MDPSVTDPESLVDHESKDLVAFQLDLAGVLEVEMAATTAPSAWDL